MISGDSLARASGSYDITPYRNDARTIRESL
jgi:hypothetical protein